MAGVSDEMRAVFEGQKRLHEATLRVQRQIEEEEAAYLEETVHGNIVRGWDGFIDSKPNRKEANPKKLKPYTEAEHLFSGCCSYTELGEEPTFDLVDYNNTREEPAGRRRLTVTLSGGAKISPEAASQAGGGASVGSGANGSHHAGGKGSGGSKLAGMKASGARGGQYTGKGGTNAAANASAAAHRAGKLFKKRKRDGLQAASRAVRDAGASAEEEDAPGGAASSASTPLRSRAGSTADSTGGEDSADVF